MMTFDGRCIAPDNELAPSLEAIALGLARESRWCGQTSTWFPVLAHTFLCADLATHAVELGQCPAETVLHVLLHDAAEVIGRDHPTTWKTDADRQREEVITARIYFALGLGDLWPLEKGMELQVGSFDLLALRAEATVLMPASIAHAPVGPVEPIAKDSPLWRAVDEAERWAANACVYPQWLAQGAFWQRIWVEDVQTAIKSAVRTIETVPGGAA